jgi:hypothetical protein
VADPRDVGGAPGQFRTCQRKSPVQKLVTAISYGVGVHEQPFAPAIDSEQVFVFKWQNSEQVFGLGGRHVGRI